MKKAFISIFAVLLAVLMLSALPVSATAIKDPHPEFILGLWSQYVKDFKEIHGFAPSKPDGDLSYREISEYNPDPNDSSKDFKLVLASYGSTEDTFSYRTDFGEYTYYYNSYYSDSRQYLIYLYNQDKAYTVEEAYYNQVEGLEPALRKLSVEALAKVGDANGDFDVNIKDATYIQQYVAKMIECGNSHPYVNNPRLFERAADLNRDHNINVKDATMLQKFIAKLLIPTTYDKTPASADSIAYTQVNLDYCSDLGNADRLITNTAQLNSYPHSTDKAYSDEFFEEKALVHIFKTYYSGMVKGFVDGVYRDGDTLYVKYREEHPPVNVGVTTDIGVFNALLEIDKELLEGVNKLSVDTNAYNLPPYNYN